MKLFALLAIGALCFAQERVQPWKMAQLKMLAGEWGVLGERGMVEFHYDMTQGMVGRARPEGVAEWRRMIVIHPEDGEVRAEFYSVNGRVIHYRLDLADGHTLRFVEDSTSGQPQRRIVYEKENPGHLTYRFETGGKVIDSGTLVMMVELRPLSE